MSAQTCWTADCSLHKCFWWNFASSLCFWEYHRSSLKVPAGMQVQVNLIERSNSKENWLQLFTLWFTCSRQGTCQTTQDSSQTAQRSAMPSPVKPCHEQWTKIPIKLFNGQKNVKSSRLYWQPAEQQHQEQVQGATRQALLLLEVGLQMLALCSDLLLCWGRESSQDMILASWSFSSIFVFYSVKKLLV